MSIAPLSPIDVPTGSRGSAPAAAPGRSPEAFRQILDRLAGAAEPAPGVLREAAEQFVSSAFLVPILNSLQESPFGEGPFAPGIGEKRFAPLLNTHLADRVTSAAGFGLVESIMERLAPTSAAAADPETPMQEHGDDAT